MIKANFALGVNCPISIELIVFLETPTISANCCWDRFFSLRDSFRLFFKTSLSSIVYTIALNASTTAKATAKSISPIPYTNFLRFFKCAYITILLLPCIAKYTIHPTNASSDLSNTSSLTRIKATQSKPPTSIPTREAFPIASNSHSSSLSLFSC